MTTEIPSFKNIYTLLLTFISLIMSAPINAQDTNRLVLPSFDMQGHRGSRGLMPENTIPAMIKAIDMGVNTLEMDVSFTRDGQAILSHEPFFSHLISIKPDGSPVSAAEELSLNIYQMDFNDVKLYDVGSRTHPRFPKQRKIKLAKPLLAEVIDASESYASEKNFPLPFYNIETKTNSLTDDIYHPAPAKFVDMLMEVIIKKGIDTRTTIQSFDIRTLQHVHNKYPSMSTSLLIEKSEGQNVSEKIARLGFTPAIISPEYSMVTPGLIRYCHSLKMKVIPWTVNDKKEIERLRNMGVDGVITDYPDLFGKERQ